MKFERTRNASRNAVFGIVLKVYQILIPFLMRSAMIYLMGVEYLGLNSLFSSILQVLNLAELGVGSAMVFSMYKPIAEDDTNKICALEYLYLVYYRFIGIFIAIVGVLLTPFIPKLIHGDIPEDINIYVLYLLNLGATVLTYWLFAYKNSLFQAHQRMDILSKVTLCTNTVQYIVQIVVLVVFHNYYYYVIAMLFANALNNILVAIRAKRLYPNYVAKGRLTKEEIKEINHRVRDLFTSKLGTTIVNSVDTIVISAFLGLTILAMYQNYYFIMTSVMGIIQVFIYSCLAGIGNSMITDSLEKNYNDFKKLIFMINWITTICVCCFACMYQPFIELWVGKEYLFDFGIVILFCIYFYLVIIQQVNGLYKDASGIWHQDRFRPLVAALCNLLLNITLVRYWGIGAIIVSTIASYVFVSMPWMINNLFKYVFKTGPLEYIYFTVKNVIVCFVIMAICIVVTSIIPINNLYCGIILNGIICVVVSNVMLWLVYRKNGYYYDMLNYLNEFTKNKYAHFLKKMGGKEKEEA